MPLILLGLRSLFSALFLVAGITKLLGGLRNSRRSLADFGVANWLVAPAGTVLPVVEVSIGLLFFPDYSARFAAISAFALLLVFNIAIAANLLAGKKPQCNCFGQLHSRPIGWPTFGRNSLFAALAAWVAWEIPRQLSIDLIQLAQKLSAKDIAVASIALVLFVGVALEGFALLHVLRQNGRLLLRMEAVEAKVATGQPQLPARPALHGLPVGTRAIPFELPTVGGGKASLESFLRQEKPVLLISTAPNCGPCNSLMPEVASWQKSLSTELTVVLLSHGRNSDTKSKVVEYGLRNVVIEKRHDIAEQYQAIGTPTAVLIRSNGTIGSPAMGGADAIRQLVTNKAWTDKGFVTFMSALGYPPPPPPREPIIPIGSKAPEFTLPDLDGNRVSSLTFNGTGTVLLFWNPQCGFCQSMLPDLKQWELKRIESAPRLMLVSAGANQANRSMGLRSTILLDDNFKVGRQYGASGTPSAIEIDGQGNVVSSLIVGAPSVLELLSGKS